MLYSIEVLTVIISISTSQALFKSTGMFITAVSVVTRVKNYVLTIESRLVTPLVTGCIFVLILSIDQQMALLGSLLGVCFPGLLGLIVGLLYPYQFWYGNPSYCIYKHSSIHLNTQ